MTTRTPLLNNNRHQIKSPVLKVSTPPATNNNNGPVSKICDSQLQNTGKFVLLFSIVSHAKPSSTSQHLD